MMQACAHLLHPLTIGRRISDCRQTVLFQVCLSGNGRRKGEQVLSALCAYGHGMPSGLCVRKSSIVAITKLFIHSLSGVRSFPDASHTHKVASSEVAVRHILLLAGTVC